ncbi:MAG: phosphotransacetylase family protein [Thermoproteota archaeon]
MRRQAVYVASPSRLAGKSMLIISLAQLAMEKGVRVGYFKPISGVCVPNPKGELVDEDAETMREILGLKTSLEVCPFRICGGSFLDYFWGEEPSRFRDSIVESYEEASAEKDLMLIEGAQTLSTGSFLGCQVPRLAPLFNANLLLVLKYDSDFVVDEALQARDYCERWGVKVSGIVLNRVEESRLKFAREVVKPMLEKEGLRLLGILPEDRVLSSLTVREVYESIGGELIAGKGGLENPVETVLIGAMTPESAIQYFRRVRNELIITGGDRTDIVLAALEAGASGIILTGNLRPSVKVLPRADELKIPMLVVPQDTYTTLQMIQKIVGKIRPRDKTRIAAARKLVQENVDWEKILNF